jgi:PPE-repeat protein
MPFIRSTVVLGCSLLGAGAIAMAVPATSSAACLLGISGLICNDGILNSSTLGPQVGIGNSGGFNGGILNSGVGNVGILNNGVANAGVLNNGALNQGVGNLGTANQGILNGGTGRQGILNFGKGSLLGLAGG